MELLCEKVICSELQALIVLTSRSWVSSFNCFRASVSACPSAVLSLVT